MVSWLSLLSVSLLSATALRHHPIAAHSRVMSLPSSDDDSSSGDEVINYLAKAQSRKVQPPQAPVKSVRGRKHMLANVRWRAISDAELRSHPLYEALPEEVSEVRSASDLSRFRQGSWQWTALHQGRLTTSKAAACLGFYEPRAATKLGVYKSLVSHGRVLSAWAELLHPALSPDRWSDLTQPPASASPSPPTGGGLSSVWTPQPSPDASPFAFAHTAPRYRRTAAPGVSSGSVRGLCSSAREARLAWGSAQEPTALLACINFLHSNQQQQQQRALMREVGLLPLEAHLPPTLHSADGSCLGPPSAQDVYALAARLLREGMLPPMGASPDGLAFMASPAGAETEAGAGAGAEEGQWVVVEAKCQAPFCDAQGGGVELHPRSKRLLDTTSTEPGAAGAEAPKPPGAWHVPQLQLEMLCAGADVKAALLVTLSALDGAVVWRVERDDEYIVEMLTWLSRFYTAYVTPNLAAPLPPPHVPAPASKASKPRGASAKAKPKPKVGRPATPPANFFWETEEYKAFVSKTLALAAAATVVQRIPQNSIQRAHESAGQALLVPE